MEVDTDDDLIESSIPNEVRSKGPPPDVTHHLPNRYTQKINLKQTLSINTTENQPLLAGGDQHSISEEQNYEDFVHLSCNFFEEDPEFTDKVKQVEFAIENNIFPQRIYEGSSGSYFAKNSEFVTIITNNVNNFSPLIFFLKIENSSCVQAKG